MWIEVKLLTTIWKGKGVGGGDVIHVQNTILIGGDLNHVVRFEQ